MRQDIVVYLRGGTYELASPFELNGQDSGSGGYNIIYQAYEGEVPVISGGKEVIGWTLHDASKNVFKASVETTLQTRQLYVNDILATRARSAENVSNFTKTLHGYTTTDVDMQYWNNTSEVEFVDFAQWRNHRCTISSISDTSVTMKEPCWSNTQADKNDDWNMGPPVWIENAYELLDEPGEWYLDHSTGNLYYIPRPGEDMATAKTVVPSLETLVKGTGTLDNPIHNIRFRDITFSHATWLKPSSDEGYAALQAGFTFNGPNRQTVQKPQAHLTFSLAKSIAFEHNTFEHMGGTGLSLELGSQDNAIAGNTFEDLSGGAVYLGELDHHPRDDEAIVSNNTIKNNYINQVGVEYFDQVGIWAGYTDGSLIEHNELSHLPYSGISVGWGWGWVDPGGPGGYTKATPARNNTIRHNLIHDYMKTLSDGGGIYTLGSQPGSEISNNYISHQKHPYASLYLDEGTKHFSVNDNVVSDAPGWLLIWNESIRNNVVQNNYSDTAAVMNRGINNILVNNVVVKDDAWPSKAESIMENAGVTDDTHSTLSAE